MWKSLCAAAALSLVASTGNAREALTPTQVDWLKAPDFGEVAKAYPGDALARNLEGTVLLNCVVAPGGALTRCATAQEKPEGLGFARAARTLTDKFQAPDAFVGGHLMTAFHFSPDLVDKQVVTRPEWSAVPPASAFQAAFPEAASKAGVLKARAVIDCEVGGDGGLKDCAAAGEDPPGYGFGQATLPLASQFRLRIWGQDGRPVVGGRLRLPIRYDLQQAPAAAEPKP